MEFDARPDRFGNPWQCSESVVPQFGLAPGFAGCGLGHARSELVGH